MRIIVPMAGMGKRMRPHTLTIPKPLIKIAGKPIVQRLVEDIAAVSKEQIEEITFIIGDFGKEIEEQLVGIAENLGAKGTICYQREALGTAHAILCAEQSLEGKVIVAFADTLFKATFTLDDEKDGILWTQKVEDPSAFGVVKMNNEGVITDFVEKPQEFVSDLAMIGIYYFKDGLNLKTELQYLIDNSIINDNEYQLPDALRNMTEKGMKFFPGSVDEWLDCGNKNATVGTHQRYLEIKNIDEKGEGVRTSNSVIIPPIYLGKNVVIENSVIGPHVSIEDNSKVSDSIIKNSMIQSNTTISNANISDSMVGNFAEVSGSSADLSVGDYNKIIL